MPIINMEYIDEACVGATPTVTRIGFRLLFSTPNGFVEVIRPDENHSLLVHLPLATLDCRMEKDIFRPIPRFFILVFSASRIHSLRTPRCLTPSDQRRV